MRSSDNIFDNITTLNRRLRILLEQYIAHISELASSLEGSDSNSYAEARENLAQALLLEAANAAEINTSSVQDIFGLVDVMAASVLASEIALKSDPKQDLYPYYSHKSTKISYMRTQGADEAYRKLSKILPLPTVEYVNSFNSVCDEVYSGYCNFGIVPIYSSQGGRLSGVDRLIRHNSLFISAVCNVKEDDNTLTFALLSAKPVLLAKPSLFDIDYSAADGYALTSMLCTLSLAGVYPQRCEMVPGNDTAWRLVFPVTSENIKGFLSCLDREYPEFSVNGFYPCIN